MQKHITRIHRMTLMIGLISLPNRLISQTNASVNQMLQALVNDSDLESAGISFRAIDLSNDSVVAEYNPKQGLSPASTTKLFTTATAFQLLGSRYMPSTYLSYTGKIDSNGVLNGNIIITGKGDPTLGSRFFYPEEKKDTFLSDWIYAIQQLGIKKINGTILADGSDFGYNGVPKGWSWSDMGNYYGAGPSGLVVYDNMTSLYFSTGSTAGDLSTLDSIRPIIPRLQLDNRVKANNVRGDQSYVFGAPYSNDWFIEGSLPLNQSGFRVKAAIPDPELLMATTFWQALKDSSIESIMPAAAMRPYYTKKEAWYYDTTLILRYQKYNVNDIAYYTNQRSVNLFAEELLCLIGYEKLGVGTTEKGLAVEENYWKSRIDVRTIELTDGSGLSRTNAISSYHFTELLKYMDRQKSNAFENTLPVAGKSGTLLHVCKGQAGQGRIVAKSGTMSRIKSYAGYVNTQSGKKLAFAIIVNNFLGSSSILVNKMEKIFNAMALL